MRASLRATVAATLAAIAVTVTAAAAMDATSAEPVDQPADVAAPTFSTTEQPAPALPDVTVSDVDSDVLEAVRSSGNGGSQSVVEVVQLTVIGGELELVTDHATITLERVAGSSRDWVGTLPPVRVIDARGTHEGWTVRWAVAELSFANASRRVRLQAEEPTVVAGVPDGLVAGQGRTLFGAKKGYGGGTYEAGATVSLRLPPSADVDEVVVELSFSLA